MSKVLLNLFTYNTGGARTFRDEFLSHITWSDDETLICLLSSKLKGSHQLVNVIYLPHYFENMILLPIVYRLVIPYLIRKHNFKKCINFGDVAIRTSIYQVLYFDWPYAVYPDSTVWNNMSSLDYIRRTLKLRMFKSDLRFIDHYIAQTRAMEKRLVSILQIPKDVITVIPMGYRRTSENLIGKRCDTFEGYLLYPTKNYSHKNVEILIELAQILKKEKSSIRLITTADSFLGMSKTKSMRLLIELGIEDYLSLTGWISTDSLEDLKKNSIGFILPTLLETYGIPYIEAMELEKPIFTTDMDFSRVTCRDAALYFDPFSAEDMYEKIHLYISDLEVRNVMHENALKLISEQASWQEVFGNILSTVRTGENCYSV
ncbi:glycosyltransferase [Schleiferiaceae bacterium]|nr:glycosyltransferase [Schleiferiaceae bacterium]